MAKGAGLLHVENRAATAGLPPFTVKSDERSDESRERTVTIPEAACPDLRAVSKASFKSGGCVALTPERFAYIRQGWRKCQAGQPWGQSKKHRPWQNRDLVNNVLRDTRKCLGKAGPTLAAPFTLRKSFGQNHADAGTPPRMLADLMGHADVQVTMRYYNKPTRESLRAAAERSARLFDAAARKVG